MGEAGRGKRTTAACPGSTGSEPAGKKAKPPVELNLQAATYQPLLSDVQNLLLRVFTDEYGENPKWLTIRGMAQIQSCQVLLVPCLDAGTVTSNAGSATALARLLRSKSGASMRSAGEVEHPTGNGAARDLDAGSRMVHSLLSARARPAVSSKTVRKRPKEEPEKKDRAPISTYLASLEERERSGYPAASCAQCPGWISTTGRRGAAGSGAPAAAEEDPDRQYLVGLDCEMVETASGVALARISLVAVDGAVLLDTLVQPSEEVTNYLTEFSGITAEMLAGVDTTLSSVQSKLLELLSEQSIIVGHSAENDLQALKLVHERVVDTCLIYPHPRGWPHRHGLAGLSSNFLKRKLDRRHGHDSIADARTSLELALLKFEKGTSFGVGTELAPLGRLLRTAGTQLCLWDKAMSAPSSEGMPWHLEGCTMETEALIPLSGAAPEPRSTASRQRLVRVAVWRDFETLCQAHLASRAVHEEEVAACLRSLDGEVARLAASLAPTELFIVLSGCGDFHRFRSLKDAGSDPDLLRRASHTFKDAFGIFAVGGEGMRVLLRDVGYVVGAAPAACEKPKVAAAAVPPRREVVSYDL